MQYDRDYLLHLSTVKEYRLPPSIPKFLQHLNISRFVSSDTKKKSEASVTFYHLNIRGIIGDTKFEYVRQLLLDHPNSILGLTESHLYPAFPSDLLQVTGYRCFRKDRVGKGGGGVLLYVPIHIPTVEIKINQPSNHEALWVKSSIGSRIVLIGCVYRPPEMSAPATQELFSQVESILLRNPGQDYVLMGDLNIDMATTSHHQLKPSLTAFCNVAGLSIKVNDYTRVAHRKCQDGTTTTSRTLIDVFLCSPAVNYSFEPPTDVSITDHRMIKTVSSYRCEVPVHKTITVIDWRRGNIEQLVAETRQVTSNPVLHQQNIDQPQQVLSSFVTTMLDAIGRNFPKRTIRVSQRNPPWITPRINSMVGRRDAAYRRWKKSGPDQHQLHHDIFRHLRQLVRRIMSEAKSLWFTNNRYNPRSIWQNINRMSNRDVRVAPPTDIDVSALNNHFVEMGQHGTTHEEMLPPSTEDYPTTSAHPFNFEPVIPSVVFNILHKMSGKKKASGPWGIPTRLLRVLTFYITEPLTNLINNCLRAGEYPDVFKVAAITPIPKITAAKLPDHFRPISLIANVSKVFEKVVQSQLVHHLKVYNLLSPEQSGFRDGHSCETLLLKVTENWKKAIDQKKYVAAAFLDFRKAFDSVSHKKLLGALNKMGVSETALQFFFSYLKDRSQYVELNSQTSERRTIKSGVPQGTCLGPLLFTIFLDGMLKCLESVEEGEAVAFADDAMVRCVGDTVTEAKTKLNTTLTHVVTWVDQSSLVLNLDKYVYMVLTTPQRKKTVETSTVKVMLGDHELHREECVRYLGVQVDQCLSWDQHFLHVKAKVNSGVCLLNRVKKGLPKEERLALYRAFVESHLRYCAPVWSAATDKNVSMVEVAQRNAIRALSDYPTGKSTNDLFIECGIEKVRRLWARLDAQWLFRLRKPEKYHTIPAYMAALVSRREATREHRLGSKWTDIDAKFTSAIGKRMFATRLMNLDLRLPKPVWDCLDLYHFSGAFNLAFEAET